MTIHIIRQPATDVQVSEMLQELGTYIKLAVDVGRNILVGGGEYHADCEDVLLEDGSRQEDIWGADWYPQSRTVKFGALINIRPRQGNFLMDISSSALRTQVEQIVRALLETQAE